MENYRPPPTAAFPYYPPPKTASVGQSKQTNMTLTVAAATHTSFFNKSPLQRQEIEKARRN
jgi:hypothetical protein